MDNRDKITHLVRAGNIKLTDEGQAALAWALATALDDQAHYLQAGKPLDDYGEDWPEVCALKARHCRAIASMGLGPGKRRWEELAQRFERYGKDDE